MAELILGVQAPSALRRYGVWALDTPWAYGSAVGPTKTEGVATRRFTWTCPAVAIEHDQPLTLTYFADATVAANRMNELAHLAERERAALDILEAMVLDAVNGIGYLGLPHPGAEITQDVVALVGSWVNDRGHPEAWQHEIARTIAAAVERLNAWQRMLQALGAVPDTEHQPSWGMKTAIRPIEPREDA